jgi:hypothetical protein
MPPSKLLSAVPNTRGPIENWKQSVTLPHSLTASQMISNIVCIHQALFETLISLPYSLAVVFVESSQSFNLVMQVTSQRLREVFDEAPELPSVIVSGKTSPRVVLKQIKSRRECSVLLYVAFHEPWDL